MTETEQLKKAAEESKMKQKDEAMQKYVDDLFDRGRKQMAVCRRSMQFAGAAIIGGLLIILATAITGSTSLMALTVVAMIFVFQVLLSAQHQIGEMGMIVAEIDGVFNTLEILGMLESGWRDRMNSRMKREKKKSMLESVWAKSKSAAQWRPYGQPVANPV